MQTPTSSTVTPTSSYLPRSQATMRANVFVAPDKIELREVPHPTAGVGEAVIRVTHTTICGTDRHILKGECPVRSGLVIGHEPVGVIEELGAGATGYAVGDRVLVGAITPCGQCLGCLSGHLSQCGHGGGYEALGGGRFGNTIDGAQAEYVRAPNAQANLAKSADALTDEQMVLLARGDRHRVRARAECRGRHPRARHPRRVQPAARARPPRGGAQRRPAAAVQLVVYAADEPRPSVIAALDPRTLLSLTHNPALAPLADAAAGRVQRALATVVAGARRAQPATTPATPEAPVEVAEEIC